MDKKKCFKCGPEKELSEFYVHKQMGDGHLNKCKDCTKNDVKVKYEENIQSEEYVEKERLRGRTKYEKYKYKNKIQHPENRSTAEYLRKQGVDLAGKEIHHWNYNFKNDVFILNPRAHKLVHKYIDFNSDTNTFMRGGIELSTKESHFYLIKSIFEENNVSYEIDTYPTDEKP